MRRWLPWVAVFVVGVLVGGGAWAWIASAVADEALVARQAELSRLTQVLETRQRALVAGQSQLEAEARTIRDVVSRSVDEVDRALANQGSAADRLRQIAAAVRRIRAELTSLP